MALVALGVTGGVSAYKAVEVCRGLQRLGHSVTAVMTEAATHFVAPLTFEAITGQPVITSQWSPGSNATIEHIALADTIDLLLVAPCTANTIGKFANGLADDFLSSLFLATRAPVVVAPAMNTNMLSHVAVQQNLDRLLSRGVQIVEPGEGYLACGWIGQGRLAEPDLIVEAADAALRSRRTSLTGRHVLVTAGPTYEDLDPVRYMGNRSSGRMGVALAAEARRRGAHVTLVAGPLAIAAPVVDTFVPVRSAEEMRNAVRTSAAGSDVVIMAAAVADYRPQVRQREKLSKDDGSLTLTLERTPDILAELGAEPRRADGGPCLVGFAAETHDVLARARDKRTRKGLDIIVANDVSAPGVGFEVETNAVTIIDAVGEETVSLRLKSDVAMRILDRIEARLDARTPVPETP